jgi:hypothetical protein
MVGDPQPMRTIGLIRKRPGVGGKNAARSLRSARRA